MKSKSPMHELGLKIIIENPVPGVIYGLQKGSGSVYETVQKQTVTGDDMEFCFSINMLSDATGLVDFRGPFVQGVKGKRFVYIDIGTAAGQTDTCWSRRLKIPLGVLNWQLIEECIASELTLETLVPGTGKDGGPNCATVKPFAGWSVLKE